MTSIYPLWWLALPVLMLPIWWHRQKRQRVKAELLATARFLPIAAPEQQRVWTLRDRLLLLVRCLLLIGLIAWLAAMVFPWRGDTVLLDDGADRVWVEQQIQAAHMENAQRMTMPGDVLSWLSEHERDWRSDARVLIVAAPGKVAMPARVPRFAHQVELRAQPNVAPAPTQTQVQASSQAQAQASAQAHASASGRTDAALRHHHVVLATVPVRRAAWQAMLSAFDAAGTGADRYVLSEAPDAATELIIWDQPGAAPSDWHAPLWWTTAAVPATQPVVQAASVAPFAPVAPSASWTLMINGIALQINDTPHGRTWSSAAWPAKDADTARAIYETWQALSAPVAPYPAPSHVFSTGKPSGPTAVEPLAWLAWLLLALFLLERILTHARRN